MTTRYDMRVSSHAARVRWLGIVGKYFEEKGIEPPAKADQYAKLEDIPMRISKIRTVFRSYSRMIKMLKRKRETLKDGSVVVPGPTEEELQKKIDVQAALASASAYAAKMKAGDVNG